MDNLSLHCIYAYRMAHTFPVESEASFEHISAACGLNVIDTRRIMRHAMTNHIFHEVRPGIVAHTAASKLLATDPLVADFVGIGCEERFQAAAYVRESFLSARSIWRMDRIVLWRYCGMESECNPIVDLWVSLIDLPLEQSVQYRI